MKITSNNDIYTQKETIRKSEGKKLMKQNDTHDITNTMKYEYIHRQTGADKLLMSSIGTPHCRFLKNVTTNLIYAA